MPFRIKFPELNFTFIVYNNILVSDKLSGESNKIFQNTTIFKWEKKSTLQTTWANIQQKIMIIHAGSLLSCDFVASFNWKVLILYTSRRIENWHGLCVLREIRHYLQETSQYKSVKFLFFYVVRDLVKNTFGVGSDVSTSMFREAKQL